MEGRLVARQAEEAHPRVRRAAGRAPAPASTSPARSTGTRVSRRAGRVTRAGATGVVDLPVHGLERRAGPRRPRGCRARGPTAAAAESVDRVVADRRQVRARRWRRTGRWSGGRAPGQPTRGAPEDDGRPRRTLGGAPRRATSEPPRGMAPRRGARRERRHPLDRGARLGVAASDASLSAILTAGLAGLVAGALSMAAGEYVSVSSQRDAELADLRLERRELEADPEGELAELAAIYEDRGLSAGLARQVAEELSAGRPPGRARPRRARASTSAPWPAPSRPRGRRRSRSRSAPSSP